VPVAGFRNLHGTFLIHRGSLRGLTGFKFKSVIAERFARLPQHWLLGDLRNTIQSVFEPNTRENVAEEILPDGEAVDSRFVNRLDERGC